MFPGDPPTQAKIFSSYLSGIPRHWYDTVVRGSIMDGKLADIYAAFEVRFGPKSVTLTSGGHRTRKHKLGAETVSAYIDDK